MPLTIRPETAADHDAIDAVTLAAFDQHPHHAPGAPVTEHLTIRRLREAGALSLSLVAEQAGQIVGHCSFSPIRIQHQPSEWLVLAPVSVLPGLQNQGIGSQLVQTGLQALRERAVPGVVVLGDSAYYQRFGFHAQHQLKPDGAPREYFFALSLQAGSSDALPQGRVQFHAAFG